MASVEASYSETALEHQSSGPPPSTAGDSNSCCFICAKVFGSSENDEKADFTEAFSDAFTASSSSEGSKALCIISSIFEYPFRTSDQFKGLTESMKDWWREQAKAESGNCCCCSECGDAFTQFYSAFRKMHLLLNEFSQLSNVLRAWSEKILEEGNKAPALKSKGRKRKVAAAGLGSGSPVKKADGIEKLENVIAIDNFEEPDPSSSASTTEGLDIKREVDLDSDFSLAIEIQKAERRRSSRIRKTEASDSAPPAATSSIQAKTLPSSEPSTTNPLPKASTSTSTATRTQPPKKVSKVVKKYGKFKKPVKKEMFQCEKCDKKFITIARLTAHVSKVHDTDAGPTSNSSIFQTPQSRCVICDQRFMTVAALAQHISSVHEEERKRRPRNFCCPKCDLSYEEYLGLRAHYENTHGEALNFCEDCGKSFVSAHHLTLHSKNVHKKIIPVDHLPLQDVKELDSLGSVSEVEHAGKVFKLRKHFLTQEDEKEDSVIAHQPHQEFIDNLFDSVVTMESDSPTKTDSVRNEEPFKCVHCNLGFRSKQQLREHVLFHEGNEPSFGCTQCPKKFFRPAALKKHMLTHSKSNKYVCGECNRIFLRSDHLKRHRENVHNPQKLKKKDANGKKVLEYPCPESKCGKVFARKEYLELHLRKHSGIKPFSCPIPTCKKAFSDRRNLAQHLVSHQNDRPFCCSTCGMTFKRSHHLSDHEETHREYVARPFVCMEPTCGKAFKLKKHLVTHELVHKGLKEHCCHVCGKAFARKDNLRQHINKVHGKELAADLLQVVQQQKLKHEENVSSNSSTSASKAEEEM